MHKSILSSLAIAFTAAIVSFVPPLSATEPTEPTTVTTPAPHCQVPCGIYTDQLRFEQMLEDTKTIAKSIASVETIAAVNAMASELKIDLCMLIFPKSDS